MILFFSLLINTGQKEYDFAFRFIFIMIASICVEYENETTQHDLVVNIKNLQQIELSAVPLECQELFLLALDILKKFEKDENINIALVYMHEQFGKNQRRLASCQYHKKIFYIYLSRTVLTKHLFSSENLKSIIYHEIGHFLCDKGLKKALHYDMLRMWLLTCLNTGMSILLDELRDYKNNYNPPYFSFLALFCIFALLQMVVLKIQNFELQADKASVTHGNLPPHIVMETLKKVHLLDNKKNDLTHYLQLNHVLFSSHPTLSKRIGYIKKLDVEYYASSAC